MKKVKNPISLKELQLFLDECSRTREPVWMTALKADGEKVEYEGWIVQSSSFKGGTHTMMHPKSHQLRRVRDVLVFSVNGHPVYI